MRFPYPRARGAAGGRAPQIGPGTFEGRTAPGCRPQDFTAVMYSPGATEPDNELWCFLSRPDPQVHYQTVAHGTSLWMDLVPEPEAFVPPANPIGFDVENALKAFARDRRQLRTGEVTSVSDWLVRAARPTPYSPLAGCPMKIEPGVYEILQVDQSGNIPTVWVWVTQAGGREIWLLYRPGDPGGFCRVGTSLATTGQTHLATELSFTRISQSGNPDSIQVGGVYVPINVFNYGDAINQLRNGIMQRPGSPVADPITDLTVDDFRTVADPTE